MKLRWQIRLTAEARRDYANILHWTVGRFGKAQARRYDKTLRSALKDLAQGPDIAGCRTREDISPGIHTLHVARKGRQGRHFVILRADPAAKAIDVLRLLHDSMDLPQHLTPTGHGT